MKSVLGINTLKIKEEPLNQMKKLSITFSKHKTEIAEGIRYQEVVVNAGNAVSFGFLYNSDDALVGLYHGGLYLGADLPGPTKTKLQGWCGYKAQVGIQGFLEKLISIVLASSALENGPCHHLGASGNGPISTCSTCSAEIPTPLVILNLQEKAARLVEEMWSGVLEKERAKEGKAVPEIPTPKGE